MHDGFGHFFCGKEIDVLPFPSGGRTSNWIVLRSMRIGWSSSFFRNTSTGRIPAGSGSAFPNFFLARSRVGIRINGYVQTFVLVVRESCWISCLSGIVAGRRARLARRRASPPSKVAAKSEKSRI